MTLKYLIQKEFLQIRRHAFLPKLIIMFPIVIMCVMPWVMQMEVKNIVVDVVDIDHTVESQRLVQQIAASNYFIFGGQKATYAEAMKDIEKGRADVILGTISWISSRSEFTPKTILTDDERADLVYAVKVAIKNDGFVKIGMYGEVKLSEK